MVLVSSFTFEFADFLEHLHSINFTQYCHCVVITFIIVKFWKQYKAMIIIVHLAHFEPELEL